MSTDRAAGDRFERVAEVARSRLSVVAGAVRERTRRLRFADWFVVGATLATLVAVGVPLAGAYGVTLAFGAGLAGAVAIASTTARNPLASAVGAVASAVAGLLGAVVVGVIALLGLRTGAAGVLTGAGLLFVVLASLGAFLAPARDLTPSVVVRSAGTTLFALVGALSVLAVRVLPEAKLRSLATESAAALVAATAGAATAADAQYGIATLLLSVAVTALCLGAAVDRFPLERRLPPDRQDAILRRVQRGRALLSRTTRGSLIAGGAAGAVLFGAARAPRTPGTAAFLRYAELLRVDGLATALPAPLGSLVASVALSGGVRFALLALAAASLATIAGLSLARSLRRGLGRSLVRLLAPVAGGIAVGTVAGFGLATPALPARLAAAAPPQVPSVVVLFVAESPPFAAAAVFAAVALLAFLAGLALLGALKLGLVVPGRGGSIALASVGLFGVAATAVVLDRLAVGLAVAAVGLAVWDVGEFGIGLREELPDRAATLRTEAVHAAASLCYCGASAFVAWVLYVRVVPRVRPPETRVAAAGLAVLVAVAIVLWFRAAPTR